MVDEPEVIRHEMEQTRASLAEKLDALGQRAADTVQASTETVENVTGAVQETVEAVQESVEGTVETVREAFDLPGWVDKYPWLAVGGAAAVGFLLGRAFAPTSSSTPSHVDWSAMSGPRLPPQETRHGDHVSNGGSRSDTEEKADDTSSDSPSSWLEGLAEKFGPEIGKLEGLALGTTLGVVREMITQGDTGDLGTKLSEVIDQVTEKLGGTPIGSSKASSSSGSEKTERKEARKEPVGAANGGRREERGDAKKVDTAPWDRRRS